MEVTLPVLLIGGGILAAVVRASRNAQGPPLPAGGNETVRGDVRAAVTEAPKCSGVRREVAALAELLRDDERVVALLPTAKSGQTRGMGVLTDRRLIFLSRASLNEKTEVLERSGISGFRKTTLGYVEVSAAGRDKPYSLSFVDDSDRDRLLVALAAG